MAISSVGTAADEVLPGDSLKLEQRLSQRVAVRRMRQGSHAIARNDAGYALPADGGRTGCTDHAEADVRGRRI